MTAARWTAGYRQLKSLNILEGPLDSVRASVRAVVFSYPAAFLFRANSLVTTLEKVPYLHRGRSYPSYGISRCPSFYR